MSIMQDQLSLQAGFLRRLPRRAIPGHWRRVRADVGACSAWQGTLPALQETPSQRHCHHAIMCSRVLPTLLTEPPHQLLGLWSLSKLNMQALPHTPLTAAASSHLPPCLCPTGLVARGLGAASCWLFPRCLPPGKLCFATVQQQPPAPPLPTLQAVQAELAVVDKTDNSIDSFARVDFHPECEAAINEQIK